ncbi:MAG: hypothetical protein ACRDEA_02460 [Microcystaceae cyanobacterium]
MTSLSTPWKSQLTYLTTSELCEVMPSSLPRRPLGTNRVPSSMLTSLVEVV